MAKHYITNNKGKKIKGSHGGNLFWSDHDGDSNPKTNQTVYEERSIGNKKIDGKYDPSKGKFKK